jgi:hypothetical protein
MLRTVFIIVQFRNLKAGKFGRWAESAYRRKLEELGREVFPIGESKVGRVS